MQKPFSLDQARGMLVGLAVGDALGAVAQGRARGTFAPVTGIDGGGPFNLKPGQWGAATSMALCVGQMLRSAHGWDAEDAMRRFGNWRDFGYLAATGACLGLDHETGAALEAYRATGNPYAGSGDAPHPGAGAIARLAPVVLAYGSRAESAQAVAQLQCRLTHASPLAQRVVANMAQVMSVGDFSILPRPDAPPEAGAGDVMTTIHAAYWALGRGGSFADVLLAAVNLGGDAMAAGAVTGQLAGRLHGYARIPQGWRDILWDHDRIVSAADDLYALRPIDV